MANGIDDKLKTPRLGDVSSPTPPKKYRLKTDEEIAAERGDSGPLIGGKGSTALGSFVGNVASGFGSVLASPFKAIDRALAAAAGTEYREEAGTIFTKAGTGIEEGIGAVAAPDEERADQFVSKLGAGLGSTLGFLIPGAALGAGVRGAAGMAGLGAAATGVEQAEDYEQARKAAGLEIDQSDQAASFFYGLLPGTLEAVPLSRMLGRYDDIVKGGLSAAVKNTAKGTVEEALQEGIQSTASNLIASDLVKYDPERDMFFDTPESAAVGGGVGFLLNSVMSAVGLRQRGKYHEAALKAGGTERVQQQKAEEEQAKINPATGEAIENSQIAKTNMLIQRYERLAGADQVNAQAYEKRIDELKKELREKYFTQDEEGNFTSSAADRQEAQDVLTRIGVQEVEEIEAAPAPFEGDIREEQVAKADPFPGRMGKAYQVSEIKNKDKIAKVMKDLEERYTPEEITITAPVEPFPTAEGIEVTDQGDVIGQLQRAMLETDRLAEPATRTVLDERPANLVLANELRRIEGLQKRREETDAAFEARKEAEIEEAYRQRELQIAEQEPVFETEEETIQPTAAEPTPTRQAEQTQEEVSTPPENSIVTASGAGYRSEAIAKAQMKRKGITGEVTEYAPGQFAIVPKVEEINIQNEIERAQQVTQRQAFPGTIPEGVQGPQDLRRQAGFGEQLPELTLTPDSDIIPGFLERKGGEGLPPINEQPDGTTVEETADAQEVQTPAEEEVVTGDDLVTAPVDTEVDTAAGKPYKSQAVETGTPEGVRPGTAGDLWTGTPDLWRDRITFVQGDKYRNTVANMTVEEIQEYRDLDRKGRTNYLDKLQARRLESLYEALLKTPVPKLKELLKTLDIPGRSKLKTKQMMVDGIRLEMNERNEAFLTGYLRLDPDPVDTAPATEVEQEVDEQAFGPRDPEIERRVDELISEVDDKGPTSVQPTDVVTASGKPYKTAAIAKAQRKRKGLLESHEVVQVEGGYVIREMESIDLGDPTIDNDPDPVDDAAGYDHAGKDTSSGTIKQIVESPVEQPEAITIDGEVYDQVIAIAQEMVASGRPERFAAQLEEAFGSVQAFVSLHSAIQAGQVVRAEPDVVETISTPNGTVESVESVRNDPIEVPVPKVEEVENNLDDVEGRLNTLDTEINDLQDQLEDPYTDAAEKSDLRKQIARKKLEIKDLESQQKNLRGEKQRISRDEETDLANLEHDVSVLEDEDMISPSSSAAIENITIDQLPQELDTGEENIRLDTLPAASPEAVTRTKAVVDRFVANMDPAFRKQVDFIVVNTPSDIKNPALRRNYEDKWQTRKPHGLYYAASGNYKDTIMIMVHDNQSRADIEWTVYHETIGHFGLKKIFGTRWTSFLDLVLKNKDLASKVFSLRTRWKAESKDDAYNLLPLPTDTEADLMEVEDTYFYNITGRTAPSRFAKTSSRGTVTVRREGMRRLMDEYLAEIAGNLSNRTFRDATKAERSLIKRIIAWIRHNLRKLGFSKVSEEISEAELISFVGESYARITGKDAPVVDKLIESNAKNRHRVWTEEKKDIPVDEMDAINQVYKPYKEQFKNANKNLINKQSFVTENIGSPSASLAPSVDLAEAANAVDESIQMSIDLGHVMSREQALNTLKSMDAREGRLDNSNHQRRVERVTDWIRRTKVGKVLSSNGHLPFSRVLNAVEAKGKGGIEKGQVFARKFARLTKDLNDIQKKAMYDYFKTKGASVDAVPVDKEVKKMLHDAKDYIEKYGESLVIQGKLSRETWEASRGSYLPIRYWQYMEGYYAAGGKRLSVQDYLKKQKGLSEEEKAALGEMKDVSFLVPETIATISRDVSLNGMFKNIITMDEVGKLGWTLGERQFTEVNGKKMKLSDIEKKIESLEFLRDVEQGVSPLYKDQPGHEEIISQLDQYYAARERANQALSAEIRDVLTERGVTDITDDMIKQVKDREYVQVHDKRYGALHKKFIRRELYDEIVESGQMYDKEHADFFGKAFGAGGYADRANQRWKSLKVTLNPPSWFRNGIGNLVLMDIGTNTSINKLIGMIVSEANSWRQGKPSKYFDIAHENGLWATTYSAAELNLMAREFKDAFKSEIKIDTSRSFMKKAWWMFDEKMAQIFEKGTEIYGGMEGFFKTVALRDYIERWEKQNNTKLENAEPRMRDAVIREAVEAANNNIFDYSKVPGWMRTMRRMPFVGAPFLTYTFKAFPYVMESFARRPQKFIKYMALPYVMAQAFMLSQDFSDDEYDELRRMMPQWQKEKSSIYLLPFKDNNGNFQTIDFGYYMPWAPFQNLGLMAANTFDPRNPLLSSANVMGKLGTDLGFLGGPIPQMTSALITNKDPFSGREIVRTVGTTMDKQNDFMRYMVDMWTPTFLTSKGVLGRTLDNLGVEPTVFNTGQQLNALGKDKETWSQTALRGVGVSVRPLDPQLALRSKVKAYQAEKRKLETARRAIFKDRNLSPESKAAKVREMNEQIKLLNKKHREEMFGE